MVSKVFEVFEAIPKPIAQMRVLANKRSFETVRFMGVVLKPWGRASPNGLKAISIGSKKFVSSYFISNSYFLIWNKTSGFAHGSFSNRRMVKEHYESISRCKTCG